MLKQVYVG